MTRSMLIMVLAGLLLAAGAAAVMAQEQGPGVGPGPGGGGREFAPEKFPEVKARILKMIDERKARLEQDRACVEKATTHEELRKCRPEPPMGPGRRGPGGPGPRGPQRPGGPEGGGQQ